MTGMDPSVRLADIGRGIPAYALALAVVATLMLGASGCQSGSSLPEPPDPAPEPTPASGLDPDALEGIEDFEEAGVFSGTSSEVRRLTYLSTPGEYRFVCTVDFAPGDQPVPVTFWIEGPHELVTPALEVTDGTTDEFYYEIPPGDDIFLYTLATETSGFASWEVTIYRRK